MSETWLLNEQPQWIGISSRDFSIQFTSNNQSFTLFRFNRSGANQYDLQYNDVVVNGGTWNNSLNSPNWTGWANSAYRTVTFETAPTGDLLTWLQANGTKQSNKLSVDLTTLSGWSNLAPGNHTIKIVAKAVGYRDSEPSAAVSVTKAAATKILAAGTYKWKDVPNFTGSPASTLFDFLDINGSSYFGVGITGTTSGYVNYFTNSGGTSWQTAFDIENEFWENTAYKTITIATDQQISAEFYDWAITGGNLVQESAAGTWLLNTTLTRPSATQRYSVNFKFPGSTLYTASGEIALQPGNFPVLRISEYDTEAGEDYAYCYYYTKSGDKYIASTNGNYYAVIYTSNNYYAVTAEMRTIQITDGVDIYNSDLIAWLKANAIKQS